MWVTEWSLENFCGRLLCVIFGSNNSFRVSCSFPSCSRVSTIIWNRLNYYVCYWYTVRCKFEKQCKCLILKNIPSQILEQKQRSFLLWRLLVCLKRLKSTFYEIVLSKQLALKGLTERWTILQCFFPMWLAVAVLCCTNFIIGGSNLTLTAYVLFRVNELLLLLV